MSFVGHIGQLIGGDRHRAKTPTVLQMEAIECGAAALAIVAEYHGLTKPLEYWRVSCGVSRDGVKAKEILTAARAHGLAAKGVKASAADLPSMGFPLILFWDFNHFLVLEHLDETTAWLNDPATGPRKLPREEFEKHYTGVALKLEPGDGFEPGGARPTLLAAIEKRLSGTRVALGVTVFLGLLLTVPGLILPAFNRVLADYFILESHPGWYWPMLGSIATVGVVQALLTWMRDRQLMKLDAKIALVGATGFFWHVLHLPVSYFAHRNASEVASRVSLNDHIAGTLTNRVALAALGLLTMFVYAIAMAQYNLGLTALAAFFAGLNLLTLRFLQNKLADGHRRLLVEEAQFFTQGSRGLQSVESLIAGGGVESFLQTLTFHQREIVNQQQVLGRQQAVLETLPTLLSSLALIALILVGGFDVMDGVITVGMLIAFQMLMSLFSAPVNELLGLGSALQQLKGNLERLDDVLHEPRDQMVLRETAGTDKTVHKLSGAIEIQDLCFRYSAFSEPVIKNVSINVAAGECIAIVGASGSGKSTLAKIIAGLHAPTSGSLLYDGKLRSELDHTALHASFAYVDQEVRLFEASIATNLSLSDRSLPVEMLTKAARAACIHDVIMRRPGGFDAAVKADGQNFSGGERQRIELARSLVLEPTILVLDEATSALDAPTEKAVVEELLSLGVTVIFVSHRLSALGNFDRILVLESGSIVETGTYAELSARAGPFARLRSA